MPKSSLSAYEEQRLANIAANRQRLIELGIESDVAAIRSDKNTCKPVKGSAQNKKIKREIVPPRSRSLRQQNLDPSGKQIPEKPTVPPPTEVQRRQRKPAVPLDASKVSTGTTSAEEASAFLARLTEQKAETHSAKKRKTVKIQVAPAPAAAAPVDVSALDLNEEDIAKLVPERIFSLEVHPDSSKLLVAAGDTWGKVGLWDIDAGDDNPVVTFEPHSRPVAGMRVPPHLPHLLISCSHDGTVRCIDLGGGGGSFMELYRAPEVEGDDAPMLHGLSRTAGEGGAIAVCRSDGAVVLLDPRTPSALPPPSVAQLHEKKIFSVDFCPSRPHLLATASLDRTVALWDVRTLGEKRPKVLATLEHGLSVTAARFSASGERLLTTCNDDLLRVYESSGKSDGAWTLLSAIKHNNKTGRYITSFQAEWLRGSESTVLCGSLGQPRGIDVYQADGTPSDRIEPENLTSVVSLIAQHPSRPVLVASNSGGKCFALR